MADTKYLCILSILREQFHYCHITHLYISTWGSRPPSRRPLLGPSGRESPWGRCPASPRPRSRGPARAPARSGGPAQRGRLTSSAASSLDTHDALLAVALARGVSRGQHGMVVGGPRVHSGLRILQSYHAASCLVLRSIHRFHNWFSHEEDTMSHMTLASASQFHVYLPCMGLVLVPSLASPTWMWSCVLTLPWPCLMSPEDSPPRARAPFVVKPPPELRLIWVFSSRLRCSFSCSLLPSLLSFFQHSHFKIGQLYILQGCELRLWPQLGTLSVIRCSVHGSMADGSVSWAICWRIFLISSYLSDLTWESSCATLSPLSDISILHIFTHQWLWKQRYFIYVQDFI